MSHNVRCRLAALLMISLSLLSGVARADQASEDKLRDQLRQTVLQLRQTEDENNELKMKSTTVSAPAPVAEPKVDKASRAQLEQARQGAHALQEKVDALQTQLDAANAQLTQAQAALAQANQALQGQLVQTHAAETKAAALQEVANREQQCRVDNGQLASISQDLLDRYAHQSVWDLLWRSEPVTRIPRIKREKLVQTYHARIVDATAIPDAAVVAGGNRMDKRYTMNH